MFPHCQCTWEGESSKKGQFDFVEMHLQRKHLKSLLCVFAVTHGSPAANCLAPLLHQFILIRTARCFSYKRFTRFCHICIYNYRCVFKASVILIYKANLLKNSGGEFARISSSAFRGYYWTNKIIFLTEVQNTRDPGWLGDELEVMNAFLTWMEERAKLTSVCAVVFFCLAPPLVIAYLQTTLPSSQPHCWF